MVKCDDAALRRVGLIYFLAALLVATGCSDGEGAASSGVEVITIENGRVPDAAVDSLGVIHVVYLSGHDVFYMSSEDEGDSFSEPTRVNSEPGFASGGLYRGPDLAVSARGDVHVVWFNDAFGQNLPESEHGVMYSRKRRAAPSFEPARNLNAIPSDNYSISVSDSSIVSVLWTAGPLYMNLSADGGDTFQEAVELQKEPCVCCGTRSIRLSNDEFYYLYRDERDNFRDMYFAAVSDSSIFSGRIRLNDRPWHINACPMSGGYFQIDRGMAHLAWESMGRIYYGLHDRITGSGVFEDIDVASSGKYPVVLTSDNRVLVAWKNATRLSWRFVQPESGDAGRVWSADSDNRDRPGGVVTTGGKFILFN